MKSIKKSLPAIIEALDEASQVFSNCKDASDNKGKPVWDDIMQRNRGDNYLLLLRRLHWNKDKQAIEVVRRPLEDGDTVLLRKDSFHIADIGCQFGLDGDKPFLLFDAWKRAMEVK